ncbi:MAG: hypothetical protein KDG55_08490 [Rhodocyclaceae bacterium]|nr:hypothetical protein [Rhodocyclaceae bacterium]
MATPEEIQERYLERVERRATFLVTIEHSGLGIYLPSEERQRVRLMESLARAIARPSELPVLKPETIRKAIDRLSSLVESMQPHLPHDVQYRNRIRRDW